MTDKPKAEIHLDFETCSELDLRKCGVYTYAEHESTKVLAVSWRVHTKDDRGEWAQGGSWRLGESKNALIPLIETMRDHDYTIHAWNAEFEWVIWRVFHEQIKHVIWTDMSAGPTGTTRKLLVPDMIPVDRMRCTMLRALYWGLPANLDQAGEALRLPQSLQKDKEGHRLMMQMNKPRTKRKGLVEPTWWHEDLDQGPDKLKRLSEYCDQDVATEIAIGERVGPVPGSEQKLWELNCEMNRRGVAIDRMFVERMIHKGEFLTGELDTQMTIITGGDVTKCSQVARLLTWMNRQPGGGNIPDCSRETMERVISNREETTELHRAAACRLQAAKSSVRKFQKMIDVAGEYPGRLLRGLTQHYGAGRTGRYAGRLVQPQNLPRPTLTPDDIAKLRKSPGDITSLEQIASLIRSSIVPRAGKFLIGDFAQIEARVLAWLANQKDVLEAFAKGEDVYKLTASKVLGKPVADITDSERHLGKVLTLACGYGMGPGRFQETAASYGIDLSAELAETYVQDWRTVNSQIVRYWKHCDSAVASVLTSDASVAGVECIDGVHIKFEYPRDSTILRIRLPSGRRLMYREPEYKPGYDDDSGFSYMGLNSYTHRWERIRSYGAKIVENVVQAVARDVMARSLWNVHTKTAYTPMLTVHDELVCETGELSGTGGLQTIMEDQPAWAPGLPIEAEVKEAKYYGK